jgi:hypothetical protein
MRKLFLAVVLCPALALAQGTGQGMGPGSGPGPGMGPRARLAPAERAERREMRSRLARTLGLAEVLELDEAQALRLRDTLRRFDERRLVAHKVKAEAKETLRTAARGDAAKAQGVEQALQRFLEADAQLEAIEREQLQAVTKDLSPEKRARAVLFLDGFERRMGPMMGPGGKGPGMRGERGHRRGMGPGPGGEWGMGSGGPEACPHGRCDPDDDDV